MPQLSQWMLRVALFYLVLGFSLGLMLLLAKVTWLPPILWTLYPFHIECLQVGWLFHLTLGTAYWILPRIQRKRPRKALAWRAFVLMNVGIGLFCMCTLAGSRWLLLARSCEFLALFLFVLHLWPRIRSFSAATHRKKSMDTIVSTQG